MDYERLARDLLAVMYQMRGRNPQKQLSDSVHGENFVLSYISEHEGNVIPSDISHAMGTTSARIAAVLNSLEGKGLISRRIDAEDRRRILIDLTAAGRERVHEHHQMIMSHITKMLQYLGEDDAKEYIRIMKKLAEKSPEDFI
ncbi:MarR family winged helix-turn-helix transcriptional regulator [Desulfosporosinus sp. PR]|uniref:MarR family winged helix-turn-helix transcriptional regulator n=1 Tax=Candidatus Desulfosporosinus nitrosoreducens TaxID=3401928 RepID=UPI0027EDC6F0|nr:MarR family winged helix-turn-helix transcriptional regulator [Desulfosporosinus sp. PR]MDQ7094370.1 MarR family winged helix-turn-helix transcriptional regulator [Desulfosporosinus sp. PR]